jgi:hypothetical protein
MAAVFFPAGLLATGIGVGGIIEAVRHGRRWRMATTTTGWIVGERERVHKVPVAKPGMLHRGLPSDFRSVTHVHVEVEYHSGGGMWSRAWLDNGPKPGKAHPDDRVPVRYEAGENGPRVLSNPRGLLSASLFFLAVGLGALGIGLCFVLYYRLRVVLLGADPDREDGDVVLEVARGERGDEFLDGAHDPLG